MELQINRLEMRTEKMQEMFNKDLEEIKKSYSTVGSLQSVFDINYFIIHYILTF